MNQNIVDRMNGAGVAFRFITPILITLIGTLLLTGQQDVKNSFKKLESHFLNHLAHHQDLEVGYERRMTILEQNSFTDKDSRKLEDSILKKLEAQN